MLRRHYAITISSNNFDDSTSTYNKIIKRLTIANDMVTVKSRIEVANTRLDSLAKCNSSSTSRSDVVLREATELDISKIKVLVSEVFQIYMDKYPSVKKFMKKSISTLPNEIDDKTNNKFWVAELKDSVIGCIGLRNISNVGEIIHTSVSATWRGQGIGRRLLSHVIGYANENSIRSLHLSVMNFLTLAQSLYLKTGFVEDEDNTQRKNDNDCYIVHMKLDLNV